MNRNSAWFMFGIFLVSLLLGPGGVAHPEERTAVDASCSLSACHSWFKAWEKKHFRAGPVMDLISPDGATYYVLGHARFTPTTGSEYYLLGAWDTTTGEELWVTLLQNGPWNKPYHMTMNADGSRIYVVGEANRQELLVVAYDTTDGDILWNVKSLDYPRRTLGRAAYLSADESTLHVLAYSWGSCCVPGEIYAYAFEAATGAKKWSIVADNTAWYASPNIHAISPDGTRAYITYESGERWRVTAIDLVAPGRLWTMDVATTHPFNNIPYDIVADHDRVYIVGQIMTRGLTDSWSTDRTREWHMATVALDGDTGQEVWRHIEKPAEWDELGFNARATRVVLDEESGRLYVGGKMNHQTTGNYHMRMLGFDAATGERLWGSSFPYTRSEVIDLALTNDGSRIYATSYAEGFRSLTVGFDTTEGEVTWSSNVYLAAGNWNHHVAVAPDGEAVFRTSTSGYDSGLQVFRQPNHPPEAIMQPLPEVVQTGTAVPLDGTASHDHDKGDAITCSWTVAPQGSGIRTDIATGCLPAYTASMDHLSDQCFRLTATDRGGFKDTDERCIYVNAPPVAAAWYAHTLVNLCQTQRFDGRSSSDPNPDGVVTEWRWSENGVPAATGALPMTGCFTSLGDHVLTLEVEDDKGATDTIDLPVSTTDQLDVSVRMSRAEYDLVNNLVNQIEGEVEVLFVTGDGADAEVDVEVRYTTGDATADLVLETIGCTPWQTTGTSSGGLFQFRVPKAVAERCLGAAGTGVAELPTDRLGNGRFEVTAFGSDSYGNHGAGATSYRVTSCVAGYCPLN